MQDNNHEQQSMMDAIIKDMKGSPVIEEALLIGIAIVGILIFLGLIFGLFDWINDALGSLFNNFNLSLVLKIIFYR